MRYTLILRLLAFAASKGLYGNSCRCLWVRLCVCNASVCTDHEIYVVAVIIAS